MAQFPQSQGQMTPHELEVANLRYRARNFTVALLKSGNFAIFGPWWAYVSRQDAGSAFIGTTDGSHLDGPYAFAEYELADALNWLNEHWDFSVPERYRDRPKAALQALASATDKSAEELGL